ncbi:MAG: diguanylate cyclase [Peptococcaceae bacterium]|jgi:predicted Fe-Mo cluster-binding NifX family protein|nr:diguanylate cyclase [Peptococcaceae bacterium]
MKIAITSIGQQLSDRHDPRFGRCDYFLIYDSEKGLQKAIRNKGQDASGGAGIAAAQQIVDEKVHVVLTGNMGPNAFNLMKEAGIKVYQCNAASCAEALELYQNEKLTELTQPGPSHHGMN